MNTFLKLAIATACASALSAAAFAQDYPTRAVQFIVPYGAGGGVDLTSRLVAKTLSEQVGVPFIVENKPGASGFVGAGVVAGSEPDGYNLLIAADTMTSAAYVVPDLTLDPRQDLVPITRIAVSPFVLIVLPSTPASSVPELIQYAKDNPDKFRWGVGVKASPAHLAIERFDKVSGITPHIAFYKGESFAVTALLSGEITAFLASSGAAQPLLRGGQVKALGISTLESSPNYPGVPTIASQGFPDFEAVAWYGIWGPKGIPEDLVANIHDKVATALADEDVQATVAGMGNAIKGSASPTEFAQLVDSEFARNKELITSLGLLPE